MNDQAFRVVLIALVLVILPIGVYHRVKAKATGRGERLDRRQEGVFILATLRPVGAAFWIGLIAWMINPRSLAWFAMPVPGAARWAGVALLALAAVLLAWTLRSLGTNLTDTVVTRQQHTLVVHGPYRWIRHPFYDCAALLMIAVSLITANGFFAVTGVAAFVLLAIRSRTEEQHLLARFGDSYRVYRERTGRFVPRLDLRPR